MYFNPHLLGGVAQIHYFYKKKRSQKSICKVMDLCDFTCLLRNLNRTSSLLYKMNFYNIFCKDIEFVLSYLISTGLRIIDLGDPSS